MTLTRSNFGESKGPLEPTNRLAAGSARRQWVVMFVGLALVAGVVLFFELGESRTLGSHEAYAVIPAREMLDTGDWIVPRFGGLPRLEKPPLCYWVVAASGRLCGGLKEWNARLPAAVSALALAVLMGVWAGRWYGRVAGFGAALAQITSVYVLIFARKAEVDMLLCLLTTWAMFLIAGHHADEPRRRAFVRWIGIYVLVALSWLAKFHYGPAMVLAPCVVYFLIQRRFRSLWHLGNPVGLALVAASVLIWPYLVAQQVPDAWSVWRAETLGRAVGELGRQPLWYYVPHLLWLSLPWTPLAIAAIPASLRRAWKERDPQERFLWIWFLVQLAIVTASANKHKHYINSTLPMLSLLAGQSLARLVARVRRGQPLVEFRWAIGLSAGCVTAAATTYAILTHKWPYLSGPAMALSAILVVGGCVVVWLLTARREFAGGCAAMLLFVSSYVCVTAWIVPARDNRLAAARFARQVRAEISAGREVCVYGMGMTPVAYYLGSPVFRLESEPALKRRLAQDRTMLLVTFETVARRLAKIGERRVRKVMVLKPHTPTPAHPPLVLLELTATSVFRSETKSRGDVASRETVSNLTERDCRDTQNFQ